MIRVTGVPCGARCCIHLVVRACYLKENLLFDSDQVKLRHLATHFRLILAENRIGMELGEGAGQEDYPSEELLRGV